MALSLSRSRDWSRAWLPRVARQSRHPSCASHVWLVHSRSLRQNLSRLLSPLNPLLLQLLFQRILALWSPRPTPTTNGTRSLTRTASLAPRPPSPSRPLPLELVGVLATSVADVSARQLSAPCGGTFDVLPSAASRAFLWRGFAGGFALGTCMFLRVMSICWSLRSSSAAPGFGGSFWCRRHWLWCGNQFGLSGNLEKPYKRHSASWVRFCEAGIFLVVTLSGEASSQVQDLLLLNITLLLTGVGDCRWCHDEAH